MMNGGVGRNRLRSRARWNKPGVIGLMLYRNTFPRKYGLIATLIAIWGFCFQSVLIAESDQGFSPADLQFFEQKIRPVLVDRCYSCHSSSAAKSGKLKGELRVDSREGLLRGGESGPAIIPKEGQNSLLLQALQHDSIKMPPEGKLPDQVIADFLRWINDGAADPRTETDALPAKKMIDIAAGRQHWAYRSLNKREVPNIALTKHRSLEVPAVILLNPIDVFVQATLDAKEIDSAPEAEKTTLIRRLYFDLIGVPPTPDEITAFLSDDSPDAYERLVDRLLASPHFGERWGRYWLSVARFAESVTLRGFIFPQAWRYRDYVINTFNDNRSFDHFVIEQVAGDLIPADSLKVRQRQLIATAFLTLGNINLEEQDKQQLRMDVVDEQLEVIGKGILAQTLGCARCHDHKFDPIPTRDYYALAGILANVKTLEHSNVSKWLELPLPLEPEQDATFHQHEAAITKVQEKIASLQRQIGGKDSVAAKELPGIVVDDRNGTIVGDWQRSQSVKPYVGDGYLHDQDKEKGEKTITFLPELPKAGKYEVRLAYTPGDNRCEAVPVTVMSADGEKVVVVNQKQRPTIDNLFVSLGEYRFELNGQGFVIVSTEGTKGHVIVDAVQFLPLEDSPDQDNPNKSIPNETIPLAQQELHSLQQQIKKLQSSGPKRPRYMSVQEEPKINDLRVHIRGTVHNLGEPVARSFLQVAAVDSIPLPNSQQSGRKELGQWLVHPDNPLTSRVFVNRIWHWLFGAGISRTPDNFGTTGDTPSHPELLDYLARRFLEGNWQIKPVIREVVLSRVYRQRSTSTAAQSSADPENRWLSHQNRRRLDAECLLDAILTVNGRRNDEIGGNTIRPGVADDYGYLQASQRRAVYWPVFRNSLPEIFEVFDFADTSTPSGSRNASTVAPQALFFLNDKWIAEQAISAAESLLAQPLANDSDRIEFLFQSTFGRSPTSQERNLAVRVLSEDRPPQTAWSLIYQSVFATFDFRYVE
jgi:hypothetical protein